MELVKQNPKIIILSGKARSGKDQVADLICKYYKIKKVKKLSYAYYLKQYVKNIIDWNGSEEDKPRDLLQFIGVELIQKQIDNKLLINRVIEDIEVYAYFYDIIVITDARLIGEIEDIKKNYPRAISIRINRELDNHLTLEQKQHITETGLDNYLKFDYIITNNDDLMELKKKIYNVLKELDYE